jgi:hypothetical protein
LLIAPRADPHERFFSSCDQRQIRGAKLEGPSTGFWMDCRQSFHNRAPGSRIRLDANAIIDG